MTAFHVELQEIIINDLQEGIFYAKLVCFTDHDTIEIDSRTSDALALAVRFGCPIYTYEHILENAGILMDEGGASKQKIEAVGVEQPFEEQDDITKLDLIALEQLLQEVLESEDYIRAIAIRDEINKRKTK
jgi:bifunctional DNase/RNase